MPQQCFQNAQTAAFFVSQLEVATSLENEFMVPYQALLGC